MRIGMGFDAHRFTEGDHIYLGGVKIPFTQGILAHSDGDVLLHALCDALLGAAALGDIGQWFPANDARFRGIDSRQLLQQVYQKLQSLSWRVINVDSVIIAEKPRVADYVMAMRENIAMDLQLAVQDVAVKATTTEQMGFTGRGEGIAAQSVVLLTASE